MFNLIGSEIRVLGLVLCGLIVGEGGLRLFGDKLSHDVTHLSSFDDVAARFDKPHAKEVQILFLGNSMTRYGVNPDVFDETIHQYWNGQLSVAKMNPDNTALADWAVAYENFFYKQNRSPDMLIIGFEGNHLTDKPSTHRNRLAYYYFDDDYRTIRDYDLRSPEEFAEFEAEHFSSLLANRDRVQTRILDVMIPHYREGIQELNTRQKALARAQAPTPTYHRLEKFLDHLAEQGVRTTFVAMPVQYDYEIDSQLQAVISAHQAEMLDCRHVDGITPEMIPDGVHMNAEAAEIYSRYIAGKLLGSIETLNHYQTQDSRNEKSVQSVLNPAVSLIDSTGSLPIHTISLSNPR